MTTKRRSLRRRACLWTAAAVLLLASYVASAHIVVQEVGRRVPVIQPVLNAFYAPLAVYSRHPALPGNKQYKQYLIWSGREFRDLTRTSSPGTTLDSPTTVNFTATPLRDVVGYIGVVNNCRIELAPDVDGDDIQI